MSASASSRVIIPGRLLWAPEQLGGDGSVPALELCSHGTEKGASRSGRYVVYHYTLEARGRAFGPLGLDSLMRFCRGLEVALEGAIAEGSPLVLSTPAADEEYRANAAVLLGAYLLLRQEWSAPEVVDRVGRAEAAAKFACAWARKDRPEEPRQLSVQDCWLGVEAARQHGWIDGSFIRDDPTMEEQCRRYTAQLARYDCAWLVPGHIMVGADPVTVLLDPNPATFDELAPCDVDGEKLELDHFSRASTAATEATVDGEEDTRSVASGASIGSSETVCKEYDVGLAEACGQEGKDDRRDFASFLRDSGVGLVVRANYDGEPGMPMDSYADGTFEPYGISQANVRVADTKGGIPRPAAVARALEHYEELTAGGLGSGAVMVHCKGGFGRSVLFACCMAMSRFDVPGRALAGWCRIARPGALTCTQQERFLKSLGGKRDVLRFAKIRTSAEGDGQVKVSCGNPCHIQ